jgi:histidine triad (HIT) family protein
MTACIFCAIGDGRAPAVVIAEEARVFAIMDRNPLNDGHVLVIPRIHAGSLFEIAEPDLLAAASLARRLALAIRGSLAPDGLHLLQNNGGAAMQSVPHFHFHLIPRWTGDGKGFDWPLVPGDPTRMRAQAERIRAALASPAPDLDRPRAAG